MALYHPGFEELPLSATVAGIGPAGDRRLALLGVRNSNDGWTLANHCRMNGAGVNLWRDIIRAIGYRLRMFYIELSYQHCIKMYDFMAAHQAAHAPVPVIAPNAAAIPDQKTAPTTHRLLPDLDETHQEQQLPEDQKVPCNEYEDHDSQEENASIPV